MNLFIVHSFTNSHYTLGIKLLPIPNKCVLFDCKYDYLCNYGMVWHLESDCSYTVQWKFSFI